jgi:tRNA(adenine34) deaminase
MDPDSAMRQALTEAGLALAAGEVPIGCVIIHDPTDHIIGRGHNLRQTSHDATAHAEIVAIRQAGVTLGQWQLEQCTLVVTLEPCPMCAGAIVNARIPRLIYGADDPKAGAVRTLYRLCEDDRLNHRLDVRSGVLAEECGEMLRDFFRQQRALGKK